jgi:acyl homoserine lactone synthase
MILATRDRAKYRDLFDQMFRLRAEIFAERLGWDVNVKDGREIDRFDAADPLYLLALDQDRRRLKGTVRLLPSNGPNMLRDVFPVLTPEGPVAHPLIWESSRFAVATDYGRQHDKGRLLNTTTGELLCGLIEVGLLIGLEKIVSVFDARMARVFRVADCPFDLIGAPTLIGDVMTYAGLFEVSNNMRSRLGEACGLPHPVLIKDLVA